MWNYFIKYFSNLFQKVNFILVKYTKEPGISRCNIQDLNCSKDLNEWCVNRHLWSWLKHTTAHVPPVSCLANEWAEQATRQPCIQPLYKHTHVWICCWCLVTKSCPTLYELMDCSPPNSSVHGTSQARILEWVAISFSKGCPQSRDQTHASCISKWILYHGAIGKAPHLDCGWCNLTSPCCSVFITILLFTTMA